jgi:hypothetical protein
VNSVIWARIFRTAFVRLDTLKFGVYDAVLCFNDGVAKRKALNILGMRSGSNRECCEADRQGKDWEGRNNNTAHLKRRKEKQKAQKRRKESQNGPDNPEYGAGKH